MSGLGLTVSTNEWEPQVRHIMVLGEPGNISIDTETKEGCLIESPCSVAVDVEVRSSNPAVVSLGRRTVHTPASLPLRAAAAGTTTITAGVGSLSRAERVDVVEAPLPLDDVQITLEKNWSDLPTQYDASGSLTWVSIPVGQTGALNIAALRGDARVIGIPLIVSSSAAGTALATAGCRPPSMDPDCGVYSDGWVVGVSPGDAQVTLTSRNISKQLTVHVVP